MNQSWFLLHINPLNQTRYVDHIAEHFPSISTYFPLYPRRTRPHGKRTPITIHSPVYPGYIFVKPDLNLSIHHLKSTPFRIHFIQFGGNISRVPEPVILELKRLESLKLLVSEKVTENPYIPGRKVCIHTPIADIQAIIVRILGETRLIVDTAVCRAIVPISAVTFK